VKVQAFFNGGCRKEKAKVVQACWSRKIREAIPVLAKKIKKPPQIERNGQ